MHRINDKPDFFISSIRSNTGYGKLDIRFSKVLYPAKYACSMVFPDKDYTFFFYWKTQICSYLTMFIPKNKIVVHEQCIDDFFPKAFSYIGKENSRISSIWYLAIRCIRTYNSETCTVYCRIPIRCLSCIYAVRYPTLAIHLQKKCCMIDGSPVVAGGHQLL